MSQKSISLIFESFDFRWWWLSELFSFPMLFVPVVKFDWILFCLFSAASELRLAEPPSSFLYRLLSSSTSSSTLVGLNVPQRVIDLWHELLLYCVMYWSGQDKLGLALRSYDVASRARTLWADEPWESQIKSQSETERARHSQSESEWAGISKSDSDRVSHR